MSKKIPSVSLLNTSQCILSSLQLLSALGYYLYQFSSIVAVVEALLYVGQVPAYIPLLVAALESTNRATAQGLTLYNNKN